MVPVTVAIERRVLPRSVAASRSAATMAGRRNDPAIQSACEPAVSRAASESRVYDRALSPPISAATY
jgi:hypothetical protein